MMNKYLKKFKVCLSLATKDNLNIVRHNKYTIMLCKKIPTVEQFTLVSVSCGGRSIQPPWIPFFVDFKITTSFL